MFNTLVNLLLLAFPLYMINVFTRVLDSRSNETLIVLFAGFAIVFIFRGFFEMLEDALMRRVSRRIDGRLSERLVQALFRQKASGEGSPGGAQALRDLDAYRQFVSQSAIKATLEAPWAGLFIGVLFILNPLVGIVAFFSVLVMVVIEIIKVASVRGSTDSTTRSSLASYSTLDLYLQSAEAVVGQGMLRRIIGRWRKIHDAALSSQMQASGRAETIGTSAGVIQYLFLGIVIAVAAAEIINGEAPPAILFATMILFRFAMRPVQKVISAWSQYVPVRQGLARIEQTLASVPPMQEKMPVPKPAGILTVKGLIYVPKGSQKPILRNINFGVEAGRSVGIVGLAGSGKTTLVRVITGCVKPSAGQVRLDGNDVWSWAQSGERWYIGYLPQNVQILPASVADNISHFGEFDEEAVVDAARMAGAHEMILRLPMGYDTLIGPGGHPVSGGQRQLIGLARAVVGSPSMVVLDEPNSNLDGPGEDALMRCVASLKASGVTVVMVSHRASLIRQLDKTVLLKEGQMVGFGETEEVYAQLGRPVLVKKKDAG
ncbi:ATP-binding cassette domain-containing protein [Microbaculum marinum]|uniref:ATP-binding cassette domain-containing protein n=1 Tax=Microbaculum marinum TaxID=1764581 RepID=A0AAW9RSW3_9HYPH